jgi:hypothetical protein
MPKGKAPRTDGIPTEFFQELVEEISPTLLQAFSAMLRRGETSEWTNKGLITLIPKSGDHAKIGNWRSITLLGSLYDALPSHGGETQVRVSQSQVTELGLGSTLPASNSRKG